MSPRLIVYVLTGLAAVVVVLTRLRLRRDGAAGRVSVGRALVDVHTVAGVLALVGWVAFLLGDRWLADDTTAVVGIVALGFWWVVVAAGLLVLLRWLPSRGRHATSGTRDSWSEGPGLSILAHVGMLVGVAVFTWAYLTAQV